MEKNKKYCAAAVLALFVFTALSCSDTPNTPPFVVSKPQCVLGEIPNVQRFAGIHFMFFNASGKTAVKITASCAVYDENGKSPFYEGNIVYGEFSGRIDSQLYADLILPLDSRITEVPEIPYHIDQLTVYRVEYDDGSEWTDMYSSLLNRGEY